MLPDLLQAIERGATVLTVNRRLARDVMERYESLQLDRGLEVWATPDVLPLSAWLKRLWQEYAYKNSKSPLVLDEHQLQAVWERLISQSESELLNLPATARTASQAWQLLRQWRVNLNELPENINADVTAFKSWAKSFQRQCHQHEWVDEASLLEYLNEYLTQDLVTLPQEIICIGFDDLTPQQQHLIEVLEAKGVVVHVQAFTDQLVAAVRLPCADVDAELHAVASWVRGLLESGAEGRIGVVVPELNQLRLQIERTFDDVLLPHAVLEQGAIPVRPYNITLGCSLSDVPVVATALQILELARGQVDLDVLGRLLMSPFIVAGEQEYGQRALFDARLRRHGETNISLRSLQRWLLADEQNRTCPRLAESIVALNSLLEARPNKQSLNDWAAFFIDILQLMGWPGERSLDSHEYQAITAWKNLHQRFTGLASVLPKLSYGDALRHLKQLSAATLSQPQSEESPVQVMGVLEAAGMQFDHLWVMGLHDGVWPTPPKPNPFLPITLQRAKDMPHASAERELQFAQRVTQRLLQATNKVIVSYPCREGDSDLRPSPLLLGLPETSLSQLRISPQVLFREKIFSSQRLETVADWQAKSLTPGHKVAGGTGLFKDQAACPFRAFARYRLAASSLAEPESGLDAAERGSLVHRVLEHVWQKLKTHEMLCRLSKGEIDTLLQQVVEDVIASEAKRYPNTFTERFSRLESDRLQQLMRDWLEIEKKRHSFTVVATEQSRHISLGGVEVDIKADRIDQIEDGEEVIVDYKTGKATVSDWFGVRPNEPQLPLYSITHPQPVAALAFGLVNNARCEFKGLGQSGDTAEGIKKYSESKYNIGKPTWAELQEEWRGNLERLAAEFREGVADVDPKEGAKTCQYCDMTTLCRINELTGVEAVEDE